MRSDYGLYVVSLICFIIAAVFLGSAIPQYPVIAISVILGILFAVAGYALRPKVAVPTPTAPPPSPPLPTEPSPPSPPPVEEEAPPPTPAPTAAPAPILEEPVRVEEEKPVEKPVRRRRRKKEA